MHDTNHPYQQKPAKADGPLMRFAITRPHGVCRAADLFPLPGVGKYTFASALSKRYIQVGGDLPTQAYIVLDYDRADGEEVWLRCGLPQPTLIVLNPESGRAHLYWELFLPVSLRPEHGPQARFYTAVLRGMTARIGADWAYPGLVAKNPLHADWRVTTYDTRYTLRSLAECVRGELGTRPLRSHGVGRNCDLFDWTRVEAYRIVREHECSWEFEVALFAYAEEANRDAYERGVFRSPFTGLPEALPVGEVCSITRSVAKYTWKYRDRFSEGKRVVRRGLLGFEPLSEAVDAADRLEAVKARQAASGVATATARAQTTRERVAAAAEELRAVGEIPTNVAIAARTGLSVDTIARHANHAR